MLALSADADSDRFDALEKAALDLAVAMTRTPAQVSDSLFARLAAEGSSKGCALRSPRDSVDPPGTR